jgi:hypothetical protein
MPQSVVDSLKPIEIKAHYSETSPAFAGLSHGGVEAHLKGGADLKASQRIVVGEVPNGLFGPLAVADIPREDGKLGYFTVSAENGIRAVVEPGAQAPSR